MIQLEDGTNRSKQDLFQYTTQLSKYSFKILCQFLNPSLNAVMWIDLGVCTFALEFESDFP
jgi:hypothetical protein